MRRCPVCIKGQMKESGMLEVKNPCTHRRHKVTVMRCDKCGYEALK